MFIVWQIISNVQNKVYKTGIKLSLVKYEADFPEVQLRHMTKDASKEEFVFVSVPTHMKSAGTLKTFKLNLKESCCWCRHGGAPGTVGG